MNDVTVTLVGAVATPPKYSVARNGFARAYLRVVSTMRRFDRGLDRWCDADTLFVGVICWRALAENVTASLDKGDPVLVTGRLRVRPYTTADGIQRESVEIDAHAIGHDLGRGTSRFLRTGRRDGPRLPAQEESAPEPTGEPVGDRPAA